MSGPLKNNCDVFATNTQGCGVRMPSQQTFGAPFNAMGGGTFAQQWDETGAETSIRSCSLSLMLTTPTGMKTWFWPRGTEPADIVAKKPTSEGWGTPANRVDATGCPMWHFSHMHFVVSLRSS